MKKILLQAYKFPPVHAPGSMRAAQIARRLQPYFDAVVVQTAQNKAAFPTDDTLSSAQVELHEIPVDDVRMQFTEKGVDAKSRVPQWLRKLYHAFPIVLFSGDGGRTYMRESVKAASETVEQQGITHLMSSFRPWADHLVCYRLKRRFPHLVWIADFRDLPVDPMRRDVWWPALQRAFQRWLLRRADVVTTVSEGLAVHLRKHHRQVVVLRNGLEQLPAVWLNAPTTEVFTISYTGSLYPGLQTAKPLFEALRALIDEKLIHPHQLRLQYAGKDGAVWEAWLAPYGLQPYNTNFGLVPLQKAQQLQRDSQMNLLLSWSSPNYGGIMTAKLGSYLSAGRPIIALLNGSADPELDQLIAATGAGWVFPFHAPESAAQLKQCILDAFRTWQFSGALPWSIPPQSLQPYTWEAQMAQFLKVLDQV